MKLCLPYVFRTFLKLLVVIAIGTVNPTIFNMAQTFDPGKFMHSPSQEVFDSLLKDDLITLGKHLDLEVKKSMKKDQMQKIILKHLVGLKLFDISVSECRFVPDVELRKLELQLELKKLEMQKEQELRERELQEKERDRLEREKERELR